MKKAKKHLKSEEGKPAQNYFPSGEELLEKAFKEMGKASVNRQGIPPIKVVKLLNGEKIREFGEYLQKELRRLAKQFPDIDSVPAFYLDILGILIDVSKLKQNLAKVNSSGKIIKQLRFRYAGDVFNSGTIAEANKVLNSFLGRSSSVIKKLNAPLAELKIESKKLKELPSIDIEAPTIVLAGYPNVGKTTMLKRLTGSKAKIAAYAFTTKQINSGFFELRYRKIQALDTPGLLDRKELNSVERKALAAMKHLANMIIFVIDPTLGCGHTLEEQATLLGHVKENFPGKKFLVVINKADTATQEEMGKAQKAVKGFSSITAGENSPDWEALKKEIEKGLDLRTNRESLFKK